MSVNAYGRKSLIFSRCAVFSPGVTICVCLNCDLLRITEIFIPSVSGKLLCASPKVTAIYNECGKYVCL